MFGHAHRLLAPNVHRKPVRLVLLHGAVRHFGFTPAVHSQSHVRHARSAGEVPNLRISADVTDDRHRVRQFRRPRDDARRRRRLRLRISSVRLRARRPRSRGRVRPPVIHKLRLRRKRPSRVFPTRRLRARRAQRRRRAANRRGNLLQVSHRSHFARSRRRRVHASRVSQHSSQTVRQAFDRSRARDVGDRLAAFARQHARE